MSIIMLGVGDIGVAKIEDLAVKTMALGSCVSVIIYDPYTHLVGMDHIALPESKINLKKAEEKPGYFADSGIPVLIEMMKSRGMRIPLNRTIVKLVGGARVMDLNNTFNIGKRNVLAIKKILWSYGMGAVAEDIGGTISRTVTAFSENGIVQISVPGQPIWEI
ncbi:MAG: chemotaxis protein CheD [Candidatus Delongbacteria bacterium]|nr:chemotaxis protein CheD [Candidatus Delongbacteria bacterium]MBN2834250.1 chemotaxis protein CheD [Candidatus Delongbacteria bacterium]